MKVTRVIDVEISDQDLFEELEKRLGVENYKIIDGSVHRYDRVSWDNYDYVPVELSQIGFHLSEKIKLVDHVKSLLLK